MRRHALRDDQRERIEGLLPGREGWVGATAEDDRPFVEAVLYRYRAGIPRRDLPERFGTWKKVHARFRRRAWPRTRRSPARRSPPRGACPGLSRGPAGRP